MKNISTFQIVFLSILVFAAVAGLGLFAFQKNTASQSTTSVILWGTMPESSFYAFQDLYRQKNGASLPLSYTFIPENQLSGRLTEALANNTSPDILLAPQDLLLSLSKRIYTIPYDSYPDRTFTDSFIDHSSIYKNENGILAVPFTIDPLILYYNRDLLAGQNIFTPSTTWGDFYVLAPRFAKRDPSGNITQSLVGLGAANNVNHAKDIFSALLLQTGNPIVTIEKGAFKSTLSREGSGLESPGVSVLRFFTEFSNPVKAVYSWNRSLPNTLDMFSSGKLAYYIGFASEVSAIKAKNPYLNFDVTALPNVKGAPQATTFGRMSGLSLVARSTNLSQAFGVISLLTTPATLSILSEATGLPPVSRSLLSRAPGADPFAPVLYNSALHSRGWLDPNPIQTTTLFGQMIESAVSGRKTLRDAVVDTNSALDALLR